MRRAKKCGCEPKAWSHENVQKWDMNGTWILATEQGRASSRTDAEALSAAMLPAPEFARKIRSARRGVVDDIAFSTFIGASSWPRS
jgi:hypothetical protein